MVCHDLYTTFPAWNSVVPLDSFGQLSLDELTFGQMLQRLCKWYIICRKYYQTLYIATGLVCNLPLKYWALARILGLSKNQPLVSSNLACKYKTRTEQVHGDDKHASLTELNE